VAGSTGEGGGTIEAEYDDGLIACSADGLLIRRYGPFLNSKSVPYSEIRGVRELELDALRRWRLWGTTDPRRWFNLDWGRPHKRVAFLVDLGKRVKPVITPDDPQRVAAVLRSHGVEVRER
jgi:hypothetical protein